MKTKKYTAVVVGAGVGGKLSMKGLSDSKNYELMAVSDLRDEPLAQAKSLYPRIRTFKNHRDMFTQCRPEVVCVSTWAPSHLEITRDALDLLPLKGILVEKPLANTTADGCKILELVRGKNIPISVPHGMLVAPHGLEIISLVQNGKIGDLKLVEIEVDGWDIINAGIHWLNFVAAMTKNAPFEYVMAGCDVSTRTYRDGFKVETTAVTYAQARNGLRVVLNTGDYVTISEQGKNTLFRIIGTQGMVDYYGWESCYRLLNAENPKGTLLTRPGNPNKHQSHLDNMAKQMDQSAPDYAVAESSLTALELCEAAYVSAKYHCLVPLPLAAFTPPKPVEWDAGQPYDSQEGGRNGRTLPPRPVH